MWSGPKSCPACGKPSVHGSRFCAAHQNDPTVSRHAGRVRDAIDRLYHTVRWFKTRHLMLSNNPVCQRLHNGVQCRNGATLVHHLLSPRQRPDLFVVPDNLVALCVNCHPSDEGTPHWREGVDFVPTKFVVLVGYTEDP